MSYATTVVKIVKGVERLGSSYVKVEMSDGS